MSWLVTAWYKGGKLNYLLAPLSLLFWLISSVRRLLFRVGLKKQNKFSVPLIVVGNISVGGTGKTPFVIYLVELLKQQGFKPAIVSRGYGAKQDKNSPFPRLVTGDSDVVLSGDEPKLLAISAKCPVVIDSNRSAAVNYAIEQTDCDLIISDDGLQHFAMSRDLVFVLLDHNRMFGNGWLLPVGPLRELPRRLKRADLVLENWGFSNSLKQGQDYILSAQNAANLFDSHTMLKQGTQVHLISGIGNPERFQNTVLGLGFDIVSTHWLPDHHPFIMEDFSQYQQNDIVLMTEKDAVKCKELVAQDDNLIKTANWYVLPIEAVISKNVEQKILALIQPFK